jgi:hypothetical protein
MNDTEARGLVLKRLYDIRKTVPQATPKDFADLKLDHIDLANAMEQLSEKRMLSLWKPIRNGATGQIDIFIAHIGAHGVDVQEGVVPPPPDIKIIHIHGSQNIIGDRNVQNVNFNLDAEKIIANINSANATNTEKEEAKSLLQKLMDNPVLKWALELVVKSHTGS